MNVVGLAVAACLAVAAVAGCGALGPAPQLDGSQSAGSSHRRAVPATDGPTAFGVQRTWTNGLAITISPPKSLQPSDVAFPRAPRAAVFEIVIDNDTTEPYKPSQLLVRATASGQPAPEVQDAAQGLSGVAGIGQYVPPGKTLTVTLGFAVPAERVPMQLTVQPNAASPRVAAVYTGPG